MEVAQTIDKAINDYYAEQGKPVPKWKQKRNPDWWTEYLIRLGLDPRNRQCYNSTIINSKSWTTNPTRQSGTERGT